MNKQAWIRQGWLIVMALTLAMGAAWGGEGGTASPAETGDKPVVAPSPAPFFHPRTRQNLHDGYLVGNGQMYAVAALGQELLRSGKSLLAPDKPAPLTQIAWIVGPSYGNANLGFGWEVRAATDGQPLPWKQERVIQPTEKTPFWGVESQGEGLTCRLTDVMIPSQPVLMRKLEILRPQGLPTSRVTLDLPVHSDPRNGAFFTVWGQPIAPSDPIWAPSVPPEQIRQIDRPAEAIVMTGARRRLYDESSTPYAMKFPTRVLATGADCENKGTSVTVNSQGINIDLGPLKGGERRTVAVWIATASTRAEALQFLTRWRKKNAERVLSQSRSEQPRPVLTRTDGQKDLMTDVIWACRDLVHAGQARCGAVFAQAYMYPMCYVRDQHGSFRLMLAAGEYERAWNMLAFFIAMENEYGIQNAHDAIPEPPDPTRYDPQSGKKDTWHNIAEVPSIPILMAKDYYEATADLSRIRSIYPRLAYNLRVQRPGKNGLLPTVGDESYTNVSPPLFTTEMTDSNLLFVAAADFMADLAGKLGHAQDASEFRARGERVRQAMMKRLWLPEQKHFVFARDESDDPKKIDRRPALDLLLRWFWLELGDPRGEIPQGCLATVLKDLCDPLQIVPAGGTCAGMDPGYLLYALARSQHPATHEAARMLLTYASGTGLFDEYYIYPGGQIAPDPSGGTLRLWESAVNGWALIHYLLGLRLDLPGRQISLQPHLPPDWPGWTSQAIELPGEGTLQMTLKRSAGGRITFELKRHGGKHPLTANVEFGAFGPRLRPESKALQPVAGRPDLLRAQFRLAPGGWFGGARHSVVFTSKD